MQAMSSVHNVLYEQQKIHTIENYVLHTYTFPPVTGLHTHDHYLQCPPIDYL